MRYMACGESGVCSRQNQITCSRQEENVGAKGVESVYVGVRTKEPWCGQTSPLPHACGAPGSVPTPGPQLSYLNTALRRGCQSAENNHLSEPLGLRVFLSFQITLMFR